MEVLAAVEPQDKPKAPEPRNLVSGGLPGMGIARDLMYVDFTVPKEVHKTRTSMLLLLGGRSRALGVDATAQDGWHHG
jgi:hypothetical protein